jgi:hypothetical protein
LATEKQHQQLIALHRVLKDRIQNCQLVDVSFIKEKLPGSIIELYGNENQGMNETCNTILFHLISTSEFYFLTKKLVNLTNTTTTTTTTNTTTIDTTTTNVNNRNNLLKRKINTNDNTNTNINKTTNNTNNTSNSTTNTNNNNINSTTNNNNNTNNLKLLIKIPIKTNFYHLWLNLIKKLSNTTQLNSKIKSFKTSTYQLKNLLTQASSWTELKYEHSLNAKQHFENDIEAINLNLNNNNNFNFNSNLNNENELKFKKNNYLIEGNNEFFESFLQLLNFIIEKFNKNEIFEKLPKSSTFKSFFINFKKIIKQLYEINQLQHNGHSLNETHENFLNQMIGIQKDPNSKFKEIELNGWYSQLFLYERNGAAKFRPVVTSVHSYPNLNLKDGGRFLCEATGEIHLFHTIHNDITFIGPVFSHYEFTNAYTTNLLNNTSWKQKLKSINEFRDETSFQTLNAWTKRLYLKTNQIPPHPLLKQKQNQFQTIKHFHHA